MYCTASLSLCSFCLSFEMPESLKEFWKEIRTVLHLVIHPLTVGSAQRSLNIRFKVLSLM